MSKGSAQCFNSKDLVSPLAVLEIPLASVDCFSQLQEIHISQPDRIYAEKLKTIQGQYYYFLEQNHSVGTTKPILLSGLSKGVACVFHVYSLCFGAFCKVHVTQTWYCSSPEGRESEQTSGKN